ncbi:MAG: alpha/beta hydrolase [Haloarculaceae archaeon]
MAEASLAGVTLHYEIAGPSDAPLVAFVGALGYGPWLWGWQAPDLTGPWQTLVWDLPGTGASDAPPADCDVTFLADALEAVLADAAVPRAHVVGAGLGGLVALLYANRYGRARSLTCFGAAPAGDAFDEDALRALALDAVDGGECERSLEGALTPTFRAERPDLVERICDWRRAEDARGTAFDRHLEAVRTFDGPQLHAVTAPALVFHGEDDPVVPAAAGRELAAGLPRGRFQAVAGRHLCFVEHAGPVTDRLAGFLETVS